jgi:hypothetical protein
MSRDKVNTDFKNAQDVSWEALIRDTKTEIKTRKQDLVSLNKSLIFFTKKRMPECHSRSIAMIYRKDIKIYLDIC